MYFYQFCLTGDTLITLSNGTSKRIDQMKHDELVLGFNGNGFQNFNFINGLQKKGLRETIKIYLQDGRKISCTPEHKFMLFDGTWCEAKDLKDKEVMCGIEYPEDIKYDNEKDWCLQVDGYKFTMNTDIEREKTLAFSRMLGYILSDGSIYTNISERSKLGYRMCSEACFGTMIDAENFKNDISKISDSNVNIRIRKSDDEERKKKGVTLSISLPSNVVNYLEDIIIGKTFPKFVLNDDCPLSIIQHFLGGLYGGDGCSLCLCHDNSFGYTIEFKWTIIKKYLNSMKNTFENLKLLLSKLGIDSDICEPLLIKYKENSIIPKDCNENPSYDVKLLVKSNNYNTFFNKINFHYCINRLTLSKNYSIKTEDTFIPSYKQKVIDIRPNDIKEVYDIEVDKVHNFLAGGIVSHNCSLYPSTIIAYNIDYSTLVTDESFPDSKCHVMVWPEHNSCLHDPKVIKKNELTAYINSEKEIIKKLREKRDKKMNKFCRQEIVDEINEKVDKLKPYIEERSQITKTISKYPMCAERSYRFLKEPKGVLPTILENLLDARANTRKLIKKNNSEIKNLGDDTKVQELTLLNNVLDKRQLSYKISANSVSSTTPIPCKINGLFIYKTIEEISKCDWKRINNEQEISSPLDNLEVWSDMGFTKPTFVMRHPKSEKLFRVNTFSGCVDCTGDHSLLRNTGEEVKPKNLNVGDDLMHRDFPLPIDTPDKPLFLSLSNELINNYVLSTVEEEIAFVYGVFFADGKCSDSTWIIYNEDLRLLERCKKILEKVENKEFSVYQDYLESRLRFCMSPLSFDFFNDVRERYMEIFYDNRSYKKFPDYIFNASLKIRQAFFMGYYNMGHNIYDRSEESGISIVKDGSRECASLFYLTKSLGYKISVTYSKDMYSNFTYRLTQSNDDIENENSIQQLEVIYRIQYEEFNRKGSIEYVYDIETENHHFAAGVGNMIVHNSMYGAMGVKKGYLPFMPGAMCLNGDSLISHSFGFTRKMKDLKHTDCLWVYNENGQIVSKGKGLIYNGKRDLVKITLIDGRVLKCTPDHKIMTTNGWVEAGKLLSKHEWDGSNFSKNSEYSKVVVGLELPEDIVGVDEKNWKLLDYTMDTSINREKTLAFCRVLGFILSDGSISSYLRKSDGKKLVSCKVYIGTLLDSQIFVNDIKIITGQEPSISDMTRPHDVKGNVFGIHIPKILVDKIILIDGVLIGKRTHQPYTLPSFIFESNCPLAVVREFLGGLFGGDGTSPSLSVSHPSFSPIEFGISTTEKYKDDMFETMSKLVILLKRFDLIFWLREPRLSRVREEFLPKDIKENPRWEYLITTNSCNSLLFSEKIGFRYCLDKSNKLTVATSYQRYSDNVKKQHINLVLKTSEMYDLNNKKIGIKETLIKMRKEIYKNEIPLHEYMSISKSSDINNYRSRPHSLKDYKLLQKYFPTARDYAKMIGCDNWFSKEQKSNTFYSIERHQKESPCINLDVVDVRYDGVDDVYDIIDVPNNSFLANGIVVHNCTTFMGRTNIEIVADTIVEKYKGKLVYGDSVTGDTPILCKINNKIYYRTIETLGNNIWENYGTKEENNPDYIEVWTENGFTKIKKIIRHKTTKEIFRVLTHTGVVDVTEDHGLLDIYKNKVSPKEISIGDALLTSELPKAEISCFKLNKNLAFVMGLFYADGSCGNYDCDSGNESTWAINKSNRSLLEKCETFLNESDKKTEYEINTLNFKILETIDSSGCLKLVPYGKGKNKFVKIWRSLFYDKDNYKKVPDELLWSNEEIRQSFLDGYYSGDGDKDENGYYRFDNKGKIGSSGLYYLATSLGYKVSINTRKDKLNIYRLTCTKGKQRIPENKIKKIESLGFIEDYVYDLETENHHFSAGIGKLIVHNTDSNYINFPHLKTAEETWDYAEKVADEISNLFPPPIKLAFEEVIYWRFFILSKKRYMYKSCLRDGVISDKVGKKGVLLARRDNSVFIRNLYEKIVMKIFNYEDRDDILYFILQELNRLCSNSIPHKDFVITKAIGDSNNLQPLDFIDEKGITKTKIGDYIVPKLSDDENERIEQFKKKDAVNEKEYYEKCLPAQMQLVEKMKRRGQIVQNGSRIEYVISNIDCHNDKQYEKIEHIDYFIEHSDVLTIDFFYYLKNAINSVDQVLNVAFSQNNNNQYKYNFKPNFIKSQYDFRYNIRRKVLDSIKDLNKPKFEFL